MRKQDEHYMKLAYNLALRAAAAGEVPVGALIVGADGEILARGSNRVERAGNATLHAEMVALARACRYTNEKYLMDATIYVTLEPCPMCMAALSHVKIARVVYGAADEKAGGAWLLPRLLWRPEVEGGVMAKECGALMTEFFRVIRARK